MLKESKQLLNNLDKYFLRKYKWRYHLLIVDNHYFHCYSFFLQAYRQGDKLLHSYDLLEIKHDKKMYEQVLKDLKAHSQLTIEYRDTHNLVHPGKDINYDTGHGHYR